MLDERRGMPRGVGDDAVEENAQETAPLQAFHPEAPAPPLAAKPP
jgi:hypothetical protein